MTRYFLLTGAPSPTALLDRADEHGPSACVVIDMAPHPGGDCYGVIELTVDNERKENAT